MWFIFGIGSYFLLRRIPFFFKNERFLQVTSHESLHAITGIFFLRKIYSLEAYDDHGVMTHSRGRFGDIFIALAPYCFPILTYVVILFRIVGANAQLQVFDFFIGLTLGFYILCYWIEARPYQTDIQFQGYLRSVLFILMMWIFHASLILLCIRKGFVNAITYLFQQYWETIVSWWNFIF